MENETTFSVPAVKADGKLNSMTSFTHGDCLGTMKAQEGGSKNNTQKMPPQHNAGARPVSVTMRYGHNLPSV